MCLYFSPAESGKDPLLSPRFLRGDHTGIQPWSTAPSVLTDCRQISLRWLSLCFSRYCSASVCDTDLSALIYQAPSCHYSPSTCSHDTLVTELVRAGRTERKMMNAVAFIRCISAEHEIFSLCTKRSMSLSAACERAEGISHLAVVPLAWMVDVLHKGHVIINHARTFTDAKAISLPSSLSLKHTHRHTHTYLLYRKSKMTTNKKKI